MCRWKWAEWVKAYETRSMYVRILNNCPNDWISTWECAILTQELTAPMFQIQHCCAGLGFPGVRIFYQSQVSFAGGLRTPAHIRPPQSYLVFETPCGSSRFSSEWASPWDLSLVSSPNQRPLITLVLTGCVWISKPSCSKDGSHKFFKRKDPGWFLVPELWNSEGLQQAQTQSLCRNVGLTGSGEVRFLPLTCSQQPQKIISLCGCYFD